MIPRRSLGGTRRLCLSGVVPVVLIAGAPGSARAIVFTEFGAIGVGEAAFDTGDGSRKGGEALI